MTDETKFIVVGVGSMGANHARVLSALKGAALVGVVDVDPTRARTVADEYGCDWSTDATSFLDAADAACVCVPSSLHRDVTLSILERRVHCLVEKPLAGTRGECVELIEIAKREGVHLAVGHVEQHNPVVQELQRILSGARIFALDARRLSYASSRVVDVDVALDLMVHDLGVVLSLSESDVVDVYGRAVGLSPGNIDYLDAVLTFDNGCIASLTASRMTQTQIRQLNVTSDMGFLSADYVTRDLSIYRHGLVAQDRQSRGGYVLDMSIERVVVPMAEPLQQELMDFRDAVRTGRPPLVTGSDALRALEIVWELKRVALGETKSG